MLCILLELETSASFLNDYICNIELKNRKRHEIMYSRLVVD